MTPATLARWCAWQALVCRACGWADLANEWTRHADAWRAIDETTYPRPAPPAAGHAAITREGD